MGACPEWYPLLRAARYLGVAPWELLERPRVWVDWAGTAEAAELDARRIIQQKETMKTS